jgi:hypothetical protein
MLQIVSPMDLLIDALSCLSAPAERQIETLLECGSDHCVDLLAIRFYEAVKEVTSTGGPILPRSTLELLDHIDEQVAGLAEDHDAWTMTGLCMRREWQQIRRSARRALAALSDSRPTLERPIARLATHH